LGLSNDDVPMKKNNVMHIWGCPTMFRREKKMFTTFGAWQNRCLVRGGFPRGGNLGRGKSLKTNIPYKQIIIACLRWAMPLRWEWSWLFSSAPGLFQQVLAYIASKYACMQSKHAKNMHIWGCPTMFRRKKKDVHHIWGCPTMFLRKNKDVFTTFGVVQWCFALKKTMFNTCGRGKINVSP
jgi:hypothetical protein